MGLSDIFSGIGDFVSNNSSWLKPVAQAGLDIYGQYQKANARDKVADLYRQREQENFNQYLAQQEAYNQAQAQAYAQNMAARRAASAAAASAAAATDANRQKAASKANKVTQKAYKQMLKLLDPYQKATSSLIDPSQKTLAGGFDTISMLSNLLKGEDKMALLKDSGPAYEIDIPIPEFMKKK